MNIHTCCIIYQKIFCVNNLYKYFYSLLQNITILRCIKTQICTNTHTHEYVFFYKYKNYTQSAQYTHLSYYTYIMYKMLYI